MRALQKLAVLQVTCGTELATLLIQAYRDDGVPAQQTSVRRILDVLQSLEKADYSPADYTTVSKAALKWLNGFGDDTSAEAAATVHAKLGRYLFRDKDQKRFPVASAHLVRSEDMDSLADMLAEACKVGH